jgi:hypothetical protein
MARSTNEIRDPQMPPVDYAGSRVLSFTRTCPEVVGTSETERRQKIEVVVYTLQPPLNAFSTPMAFSRFFSSKV